MSKFGALVELHNQYGDVVCELEKDASGYYRIPAGTIIKLDVDDVLTVVEIEHEM